MNLYAVVPGYNEEKHIIEVAEGIKKHMSPDRIIIVDDGSRDDFYKEAKKTGATVLRHIVNLGKGAALKTGCDYALRKGADAIILIDSDGQHDPDEIPKFAKALDTSEMVFGYRKLGGQMPIVLKIGNWIISKAIETLFRMRIKDTQCGYRAFTSGTYRKIRWTAADYSVESEMIALAGKHRIKYSHIPIATIYHDKYKGTTAIDGLSIAMKMVWWKFTR